MQPHTDLSTVLTGSGIALPVGAANLAFLQRQLRQHADAVNVLDGIGDALAFLGSARVKPGERLYEATVEWAAHAARELVAQIVHGGGPGLMEAAGKGGRLADMLSIGLCLTLERFADGDDDLDLKVQFEDFGPRLDAFLRVGNLAWVHFPGGVGTLHELYYAADTIGKGKAAPRPLLLAEPFPDDPFWQSHVQWLNDEPGKLGMVGEKELGLIKIVRNKFEMVEAIREFWAVR